MYTFAFDGGRDTIIDFGLDEVIDLRGLALVDDIGDVEAAATSDAGDLVLTFDANQLTVLNTAMGSLDEDNFLLL